MSAHGTSVDVTDKDLGYLPGFVEDGTPTPALPAGVPGAVSNTPPTTGHSSLTGNPGQPGVTAQGGEARTALRRESVVNYEVDRTVRVVRDGALLPTPFLDLTDRVGEGGEGGLLGLAFPPDHASSGVFYVYYTDRDQPAGSSVLSRFRVTADPDVWTPPETDLRPQVTQKETTA